MLIFLKLYSSPIEEEHSDLSIHCHKYQIYELYTVCLRVLFQ